MKFSIGSNLDDNMIIGVNNIIKGNNNFTNDDIEFFLSYPGFNHSLNRYIDQRINIKVFFEHIKLIMRYGFSVRYIFNLPKVNLFAEKENLDFVLKNLRTLGVNKLTIADKDLIKYVSNNYD